MTANGISLGNEENILELDKGGDGTMYEKSQDSILEKGEFYGV